MKAHSPPPAEAPVVPEQPVPPEQVPPESAGTAEGLPPGASTPPAPRVAEWPEWFTALDIVLGMVAVILAFLLASFAARNSDFWLQLASGRLIAQGQLHLGADPFSYADAARPWVHTSWLYDLGLYLGYLADPTGAALVAGKAVLFALTFALLYFLRRPGQALWPWAVVGVLAMLAATPYAQLRPSILSMLFLSLTMVLIARLPWRADSWREPLILAGLFAVWANCDVWFFLGPLALLCVVVGEYLHRFLAPGEGKEVSEAGPFPAPASVPALVKALGLGVVAMALNPYFLAAAVKDPAEAVTQLLPLELSFNLPAGASEDAELAFLTLSPLNPTYQSRKHLGNSVNGLSYGLLLILGAGTLVLGFGRLRASHIALWVVFGGLSLVHLRLIPFFAIVVAPVVAGHLNGLSGGLRLRSVTDPRTRIVLTASGFGRLLCIIAGFLMLAVTYPGWLHPQAPANTPQNRLDWSLVTDAGLERSAKVVAALRVDRDLPEGLHGLALSNDFGNYAAWFAPGERVFTNWRFTYHRKELADMLALRQVLAGRRGPNDPPASREEVSRVLDERGAGYLVLASSASRRIDGELALNLALELMQDEARWVPWHLDGRVSLLGRLGGDAARNALTKSLRLDLARQAFGPDVAKLPEVKARAPLPPPQELAEEFLARPLPIPPEADDARAFKAYAELTQARADLEYNRAAQLDTIAQWAILGGGRPAIVKLRQVDDEQFTVPILMIRAARQAMAANPDDPEAYYWLIEAYTMNFAPALDEQGLTGLSERQLQTLTAQARYLDRLPPPGQGAPYQAFNAMRQSQLLSMTYERTGQLDAAKKAFDRHVRYFESLNEEQQKYYVSQNTQAKPEDVLKGLKAEMQNKQDQLSRAMQRNADTLARLTEPTARFNGAIQAGMPLEALKTFDAMPSGGGKGVPPQLIIQKIVLQLRAGQLEEASQHLTALEEGIQEIARGTPDDPIVQAFKELQILCARLEGNYGLAGTIRPKPAFPKVPWDKSVQNGPGVLAGLSGLAGSTMGLLATEEGINSRTPLAGYVMGHIQTRNVLQRESLYAYDRALLAMLDGNVADATLWLQQSALPQGVPLTLLGDDERAARIARYLALIQRGQKPPAHKP